MSIIPCWLSIDHLLIMIIIWILSDYLLMIIWWISEYHLNIIWISSDSHLKTIPYWLSDFHWKSIRWSYDDYPIIIWRASDDPLMIIRRWSSVNYLIIVCLIFIDYLIWSEHHLHIIWRSSNDYLKMTICSFYDYSVLNIPWSSVNDLMIMGQLFDEYMLIISLPVKYLLLIFW